MPNRFAYAGEPASGEGYPSIPMQAETKAFFARFTGNVSPQFRAALNQAIFRWKRDGVWSLILDLFVLMAETQTDALRNVISAARDGTSTGSPLATFTAKKGFNVPLGASLNLPRNQSQTWVSPLIGYAIDIRLPNAGDPGTQDATFIGSGTNQGEIRTMPGGSTGWTFGGGNSVSPSVSQLLGGPGIVVGTTGIDEWYGGGFHSKSGSFSGTLRNALTISPNFSNFTVNRVSAAFLLNNATTLQRLKFMSTLQGLIDDMQAFA